MMLMYKLFDSEQAISDYFSRGGELEFSYHGCKYSVCPVMQDLICFGKQNDDSHDVLFSDPNEFMDMSIENVLVRNVWKNFDVTFSFLS